MVPSYTASLERDVTGTLVTLWRGVNYGDYVDHDILANRGKGPLSAWVRAEREQAGLGDWFVTVTITEGRCP
jgi:hypothetical protein